MDKILDRILECIGPGHGEAKNLADAIKINPQIITNWKCGNSKSYLKYVDKIAEYYGVSSSWILGKTDTKKEPAEPDLDELIKDEPIAAYNNLKKHLTEADKADIAQLIRLRAEINKSKE